MLYTLSLWVCAYMLGRATHVLFSPLVPVDRLSKLVCLYNGYSVRLAGFTVIIYFVLYTLVPLVGLLV